MKPRLMALIGVTLAAASSCKEGPKAGELSVNLTTPNSDDGAIQFVATAGASQTITGVSSACSGCKLFFAKVSDTQYKGVVVGNLASGTLFRVGVSDTKTPTNYTVQIIGVSSRTFALRTASGYSVTLVP